VPAGKKKWKEGRKEGRGGGAHNLAIEVAKAAEGKKARARAPSSGVACSLAKLGELVALGVEQSRTCRHVCVTASVHVATRSSSSSTTTTTTSTTTHEAPFRLREGRGRAAEQGMRIERRRRRRRRIGRRGAQP
jgi:hypothetical protein